MAGFVRCPLAAICENLASKSGLANVVRAWPALANVVHAWPALANVVRAWPRGFRPCISTSTWRLGAGKANLKHNLFTLLLVAYFKGTT